MPILASTPHEPELLPLPHRGDRRSKPIWNGVAAAALLLTFAAPAARAQDGKSDDQYKYTPEKPQAPQRPQSNYQAPQYPQYQQQQYQQYKPPQYPQYKPPQYQPFKPGQYLQYPIPKGPPGQYRGSAQDQQACINDVFRLCNQFIPDAARIVACLQSSKKNLSPPCRAVFSRSHKAR